MTMEHTPPQFITVTINREGGTPARVRSSAIDWYTTYQGITMVYLRGMDEFGAIRVLETPEEIDALLEAMR